MTLDELIDHLSDLRDDFGGDTEVRLAFQERWPLAFRVGNVRAIPVNDSDEDDVDDDDRDYDPDEDEKVIVWIAEGSQPREAPYAPRSAWERY